MSDYRLYELNSAGHFVGVTVLQCADDEAAVAIAHQKSNEAARELWCRDRLVAKFSTPDQQARL